MKHQWKHQFNFQKNILHLHGIFTFNCTSVLYKLTILLTELDAFLSMARYVIVLVLEKNKYTDKLKNTTPKTYRTKRHNIGYVASMTCGFHGCTFTRQHKVANNIIRDVWTWKFILESVLRKSKSRNETENRISVGLLKSKNEIRYPQFF